MTTTIATNTILIWMCLLMLSIVPTTLVSAMVSPSPPSPSSLKIRVCQGSGCLGKCRGAFDPLTSFENLLLGNDASDGGAELEGECATATLTPTASTISNIELEKTFCMNQCKRGPNIRMINADNGNVLTFDSTIMNETESNRKSFQGVNNDNRVKHLWGIANKVAEGSMVGTEQGSVDKLNDIMPEK